jgi:hypothetical protein
MIQAILFIMRRDNTMFSSSSSSSKPRTEHPFFKPGLEDLIRHTWFFASNSPEQLSLINRTTSHAINHPTYWRQLLQRDFGMSPKYCNRITEGKKAVDHVKVLRMVYLRLQHSKETHRGIYNIFYHPLIIGREINFPPLIATIAPFPDIDETDLSFYLYESIRLRNTRLAEHILLRLFPEGGMPRHEFVDNDTINIAIETDNIPLLNRMLPNKLISSANGFPVENYYHNRIEWILNHSAVPPSAAEATGYLNQAIYKNEIAFASILLRKGATPNSDTLKITASHVVDSYFPDQRRLRLVCEILSWVQKQPTLLNMTMAPHQDFEAIFSRIYTRLVEKQDLNLIQAVCESAAGFPALFNEVRLHMLRMSFFRIAVMCGALSNLQSPPWPLESLGVKGAIINQLISIAIDHGQLEIVKHLIAQLDKNDVVLTKNVRDAIRCCRYLNVVQYFMEEFKEVESKQNGSSPKKLNSLLETPLIDVQAWLNLVVQLSPLDIIHYFVNKAPAPFRLTPTPNTLELAIRSNQVNVVRYFVENCNLKIDKTCLYYAIMQDPKIYGSSAAYLLSQCLNDVSPAHCSSRQILKAVHHMRQPNEPANKVLDWLTGPESKNRGFTLHPDDFTGSVDSKEENFKMLAWMSVKLNMKISPLILDHMIDVIFQSTQMDSACRPAWKKILTESYAIFHAQFESALHANSTLNRAETKDEEFARKKQKILHQVQSGLSLDDHVTTTEDSIELSSSSSSSSMQYRR